jgi:hypothetical protein
MPERGNFDGLYKQLQGVFWNKITKNGYFDGLYKQVT